MRRGPVLLMMITLVAAGCGKEKAPAPPAPPASPASAATSPKAGGVKAPEPAVDQAAASAKTPKTGADRKMVEPPPGPDPANIPPNPNPPIDPRNPPAPAGTLAHDLQARLTAFRAKAPQALQDLIDTAVTDLGSGSLVGRAKNNDDTAPDFTLKDATGKEVSLSGLLKKGPVVLTWYRGGWCPYCNLTLRHYAKMVPALSKAGVTLVALTPDTPDKSLSLKQKLKLPFVVLSDTHLKVAKAYGLVYRLPPKLKAVYDKKFKPASFSGITTGDLPLAATYVIGTDSVIRYSFVDAEYRRRAEPAEILTAVQSRVLKNGPAPSPDAPGAKVAPAPGKAATPPAPGSTAPGQ
ncbi:MAG: AhpC/TSA family protein [Myxococcales bacterium]|nr:AhpC/TSA family protein [Myxococcales bacterium]